MTGCDVTLILALINLFSEISGLTLTVGECKSGVPGGVIGKETILDCSLDGDAWSSGSTRRWKGPPTNTLLIGGGSLTSAGAGYQEVLDNVNTDNKISLKILSLTWANVDEQYTCEYKFNSDPYTLAKTSIEDYLNTTESYSDFTSRLNINGTITLSEIYPVPTPKVIINNGSSEYDITNEVTIVNMTSGNGYQVVFGIAKTVTSDKDYINVSLSTPCGYSYSHTFYAESHGFYGTWFVGWVIGLVADGIVFIAEVCLLYCLRNKEKQNTATWRDISVDVLCSIAFDCLIIGANIISLLCIVLPLCVAPNQDCSNLVYIGYGFLASFLMVLICYGIYHIIGYFSKKAIEYKWPCCKKTEKQSAPFIAPPSAPEGPVTVKNANHDSVKLEWKQPKDDGGVPIDGYSVKTKHMGKEKSQWEPVTNKISSTTCIVPHLEKGHKYMIRVEAFNSKGSGKPLEIEITAGNPVIVERERSPSFENKVGPESPKKDPEDSKSKEKPTGTATKFVHSESVVNPPASVTGIEMEQQTRRNEEGKAGSLLEQVSPERKLPDKPDDMHHIINLPAAVKKDKLEPIDSSRKPKEKEK